MKRIKKGFTLTELLISIGVLAVIAAIAIPLTIGIMNKGSETSEDVNTALYTSIMNKYAAEKVEEADVYPRLTTVGTEAEYPMFAEKAGQGSFPGFNVIAGVDLQNISKALQSGNESLIYTALAYRDKAFETYEIILSDIKKLAERLKIEDKEFFEWSLNNAVQEEDETAILKVKEG